jgi:hypothetical protein
MTLRPATAWAPPRALARARSAQCGSPQRKRARIWRRRPGGLDSPRRVCAPVRRSRASVRVPMAKRGCPWENRIRPGCRETTAATYVPPLRSDSQAAVCCGPRCGFPLRQQWRRSAPAPNLLSLDQCQRCIWPSTKISSSNPHLLRRCGSVAMKVRPQPAQPPSGRHPEATAADSLPSRASLCVVTHRELAALPPRSRSI